MNVCVGSGAFGTTYLATRMDDGAQVAVKEMLVRRADSLKIIELFEREAAILKRLDHPGIPKYFEDFVHEAGRNTAFYLVQEYVEGECLIGVVGTSRHRLSGLARNRLNVHATVE